MLEEAQRWLDLSIQMKFKIRRQLEACDVLFKLSMILGEVERAVSVAEQGVQRAIIGFGRLSKIEGDWMSRKNNPVLYMIG